MKFKGNLLITGPQAGGKTTLAELLATGLNAQGIDVIIFDIYANRFVAHPRPRSPLYRRRATVKIYTAVTIENFHQVGRTEFKRRPHIARHLVLQPQPICLTSAASKPDANPKWNRNRKKI